MTEAEKILIRWLSGLSAAGAGAVAAADQLGVADISNNFLLYVVIAVAAVNALITSVTSSSVSEKLGIRKAINRRG